MDEEHCCSVTLIVLGDDLEPDIVTAALGWNADQAWRSGEHNRIEWPDGTVRVFESIAEWGGWKRFTPDDERTLSLQDQIDTWRERLQDKGPALRSMQDRGWEVELNCFAATYECLDLPAAVLRELADLGVGLCFTFSVNA